MKTMKLKCTMCGKEKRDTEFYKSYSILFKNNFEKMCICKDCVLDLYASFLLKANNRKRAVWRVCNTLDMYFSNIVFESVEIQSENSGGNLMGIYMQKINSLKQYRDLTSEDSEEYVSDENNKNTNNDGESEEFQVSNITDITNEMQKRWGYETSHNDILFLENIYWEYYNNYEHDTPVQKMLYKQISWTMLQADKAIREGKTSEYTKMMDTLSKLLNDGNLKPIQATAEKTSISSFGEFIKMIEETEPIPEPLPEFKDVDGIGKYIERWFVKHFARILNLDNAPVEEDMQYMDEVQEVQGDEDE